MADAILAQSGIYAFTNKINGKKYVGSAVNLRRRHRKHLYELNKGSHHSLKFQRAWNKYGQDSFQFEIVEIIGVEADLIVREQHWMAAYGAFGPNGYNMSPTAGSILGIKRSPETIEKMRISGRRYVASPEARKKISLANTGRKASPEQLEKMRGVVKSAATIEKLRGANIGKTMSAESIAKTRAANVGVPKTEAAKEKMRQAKLGRKFSANHKAAHLAAMNRPEVLAKFSAASTGRRQSTETIAKRVDGTRRSIAARMSAMTPEERDAYRIFRKHSPELIARRAASIKAAWARKKTQQENRE